MIDRHLFSFCILLAQAVIAFPAEPLLLLEERFEDTNLGARGWYDGAKITLSSTEHIAGSTKSVEFHWVKGGTSPASGGAFRRKFSASESRTPDMGGPENVRFFRISRLHGWQKPGAGPFLESTLGKR